MSIYGKAKLLSTNFLITLNKKYNFPVNILRLYLVYGPSQEPNRIIPFTILNSILDKEFDCSSGNQFRDFLYIDDLTKVIIRVLKKDKISGEIINIGHGKPVQKKKIIKQISKKIKLGQPKFGKIKLRKDEITKLYPNIAKAKKMLDWKPKIKLNLGLDKTINYYKKNRLNFLSNK